MLRRGYAWTNLIEASPVFRFSAGARLCRITPPRNSSGCCHSAGIRHDPGFGITVQRMRDREGEKLNCAPEASGSSEARRCDLKGSTVVLARSLQQIVVPPG